MIDIDHFKSVNDRWGHAAIALAVAELGSIRQAGRHVGVAQPAITRSIQELEQELGVPLFESRSILRCSSSVL